jgi:nucleoside-diphosphate-sugar epimerase
MRLLVLGGTRFLSQAVATLAVDAGHDVTCAARGVSGPIPAGAAHVKIDRDVPDGLAPLRGQEFDAVLETSSTPSRVRAAVADLSERVGHVTYVSSGSVYTDDAAVGATVVDSPVFDPAPPEIDDPFALENYGPCKVACEQAVTGAFGPDRSFVCRAGLIIGPGDPSNRFPYWVSRLADGGEVLAPGDPGDLVQYVDVRDLAAWILHAAETGLAGIFDGIGRPVTREHFLTHVAAGVDSAATLTWLPQEFLVAQKVEPWAGNRSLPLWLPVPEYGGFMSRDVTASLDAGLSTRDVSRTAGDTLAWLHTRAEPLRGAGLERADEAAVLAAWRSSPA